MISALLGVLLSTAHAGPLNAYFKNREGLNALAKKDGLGAYRAFTRGLADDPLNMALQLNLGTTFEQNEEYDKAAAIYRGALAALPPDAPQRFEIAFNLGNVLAAAKKIPAALAAYQQALEVKPDSIEVKTNIELLFAGGKGDGQSSDQNSDQDQKNKDSKDEKKDDKKSNQEKREDALKDQKPEKKDGDKPKPKPFDSKELSAEDVKRILDEIKNQEQSIRAEEYDKNPKDTPRGGKDW